MSDMFGGCENLKELDVTRFDTSHVMDMAGMFCDCENFTELDVTGFDTGCVTNMSWMFRGCKNLIELDGSENIKYKYNIADKKDMFEGCEKLEI